MHNSLKVFLQRFILKIGAQLSALKYSINCDILVIYERLNHFFTRHKRKFQSKQRKREFVN